ncbi:hypothetical protein DFJ58DRAFT_737991 [Suillus subalutaceus]|uniref:uncharacterized protein n=1 Tax=Suillus subalutaceus TaxID=48586 RepID=UPI001B871397|nr:uncharacterized protein DFJ58DRAFT_737991 [Suillus subalutaceus]KAG1828057.1 hypothetical protein DFJ58DRAFT_737991 [Suillus subalutaceus]
MLTPAKSLAKPSKTTTMLSATQASRFTMSSIATLHTSMKLGGLHPSYISFNATAKQTDERTLSHDALVEAALQDVFDALTIQDRLDATASTTPEQLPINVYITPRELHESSERIGGDVAVWVQAFAQEFAIPHLQRFNTRCLIEDIKPQRQSSHISSKGPQHLPAPMVATGARIQCSAQAAQAFSGELQASTARIAPSAAIREVADIGASREKKNAASPSTVRRHRNADAASDPLFLEPSLKQESRLYGLPLISIGPNTDAALDRLRLGDENLPKLRLLVQTARSSRWEAVLRSPKWDLSYEHVSILSMALFADLHVMQVSPEVVKQKTSVLTVILKLLGTLITFSICLAMSRTLDVSVTMVIQSFYTKSRSRHVQAPPRTRPKVTLSKEARTALKLQRNKKSRQFKDTLDVAWSQINDATRTIATSHHKSIRRVENELYMGHGLLRSKLSKVNTWNAFCWKKSQDAKKENSSRHGKDTLRTLVCDNKAEYDALSEQEQEALLKEYAEEKQTKATGTRVSTKSKVNDITQTLKAVENELHSLNCRTGAEVVFYMTRGSTDLPIRAITFTTDGVKNFMGSVMGIDNQDLISKMEGFAVQGVQGAAKNHQQRVSQVCGSIQDVINCGLQKVTGEPLAKMQWAYYFRNVVQRYQVSSALPELEMLLRKWESGATYWKVLDDEEFEQLRRERDDKLDRGDITDRCRRTRSDKGSKRCGHPTADNSHSGGCKKTMYSSAEIVESSDEEEIQPDQLPTANQ